MPSHTPYKVERMLQDRGERRSELQTSPSLNTGVEEDEGECSPDGPLQLASIEPLPVQVIERNRLSLEEIRKLPRFGDYAPGLPAKVGACAVQGTLLVLRAECTSPLPPPPPFPII